VIGNEGQNKKKKKKPLQPVLTGYTVNHFFNHFLKNIILFKKNVTDYIDQSTNQKNDISRCEPIDGKESKAR
jgi:hypothetical protein